MKFGGSYFTLASGRRFYANAGILGIDSDGYLTEGYDGNVENTMMGDLDDHPFTAEERQEIGEYMVARWKEWAAKAPDISPDASEKVGEVDGGKSLSGKAPEEGLEPPTR
jgi:dUTPase